MTIFFCDNQTASTFKQEYGAVRLIMGSTYNLRSSVFGCPEHGTIFGSEAEDRQLSLPKTVAEAEPSPITNYDL